MVRKLLKKMPVPDAGAGVERRSQMNRLTYWNDEYGCWSYHCASGDAANALAAYENTGLAPEEIASFKADVEEVKASVDQLYRNQDLFKRLEEKGVIDMDAMVNHALELVEDEQAGKLKRLPVAPGGQVFIIQKKAGVCIGCEHEAEALRNYMMGNLLCDRKNYVNCLRIQEYVVQGYEIGPSGDVSEPGDWDQFMFVPFSGVDDHWYSTREEAEAALAEMKEGQK